MRGEASLNPSRHRGRGWPASAGRVRGRRQSRLDRRPNSLEVLQHIVVPKTNDAEILALEVSSPACVALGRMLSAIYLNDQTFLRAKEIDDVAVDFDLLAELEAVELSPAEDAPELAFCIRRVLAQRSRPARQKVVLCRVSPSPGSFGPTLCRDGERVLAGPRRIHA